MVTDAKWALSKGIATRYFVFILVEVQRLLTGLLVAIFAKMSSIEADIQGDITAEPALVVNVLVSMSYLATGDLANTDLFI